MNTDVAGPLAVAVVTGLLVILGNLISKRMDRRESSEQAAQETLDEVWAQRVTFRDEQIEALRTQVLALTEEVRRLTARITELGGTT